MVLLSLGKYNKLITVSIKNIDYINLLSRLKQSLTRHVNNMTIKYLQARTPQCNATPIIQNLLSLAAVKTDFVYDCTRVQLGHCNFRNLYPDFH